MTLKKSLLLLLVALCLALAAVLAWLLLFYKSPPVDPEWALSGSADVPAGAVTVRFTGTSTLLFSDGETRWMVDGWFSRPGPLRVLLGKVAPDLEAIERGLATPTIRARFPVRNPIINILNLQAWKLGCVHRRAARPGGAQAAHSASPGGECVPLGGIRWLLVGRPGCGIVSGQ